MQHNRDRFDDAEPVKTWLYESEVRPYADFKRQKAVDQTRIEITEISMASRRITEDYPDQAVWYCLAVKPYRELSVEKALTERNVEVFVALHPAKKVLKRGRRVDVPARPVLAGYILVRCIGGSRLTDKGNQALRGLLAFDGVIDVVGGATNPRRVPDEEIERFKGLALSGAFDEPEEDPARLMPGMKLKVVAGPFLDFIVEVAQPEGKSDVITERSTEIPVEVVIFGRASKMMMPLAMLKII